MNRYTESDVKSRVSAYEFGDDWIHVEFSDGVVYEYTHASAGAHYIEMMKRLAKAGVALNEFIDMHVKHKYSRRVR